MKSTLATWDGTSDLMVSMRTTRYAAVAAGAAMLLVAGCSEGGGDASPEETTTPKNVLAGIDPCQILSAEEARAQGADEPGESVDQGIGEQGCRYDGGDYLFTIYKGEEDSLSYWEGKRENFAVFEPNTVGSRNGIKQVTNGAVNQGICSQVIEAGSGSVSVQVKYDADKTPSDEAVCAKAMEIAQVVEPKLPK